jgi:hypothetical protein
MLQLGEIKELCLRTGQKQLNDKKEWQSTAVDSWELWATEHEGKGQRNKPYGVYASGGSTEHCTADSIHVWLTVT